ncbi:hypothetical protein PSP6_50004 [Paraburkholderia tropica]|nr:hypothetical protein PSP6_50004 [Paraburkholderia tropica]
MGNSDCEKQAAAETLVEFIHDVLQLREFPWASFPHQVGLHHSCGTLRAASIGDESRRSGTRASEALSRGHQWRGQGSCDMAARGALQSAQRPGQAARATRSAEADLPRRVSETQQEEQVMSSRDAILSRLREVGRAARRQLVRRGRA